MLVSQELAVMPEDLHLNAAVVELVLGLAAPAVPVEVVDHEAVLIIVADFPAVDGPSARRLVLHEAGGCRHHDRPRALARPRHRYCRRNRREGSPATPRKPRADRNSVQAPRCSSRSYTANAGHRMASTIA